MEKTEKMFELDDEKLSAVTGGNAETEIRLNEPIVALLTSPNWNLAQLRVVLNTAESEAGKAINNGSLTDKEYKNLMRNINNLRNQYGIK